MNDRLYQDTPIDQLIKWVDEVEIGDGEGDLACEAYLEYTGLQAQNAAMLEALTAIENEMNHWENTDDPIPQEERRKLADIATEAIRAAKG